MKASEFSYEKDESMVNGTEAFRRHEPQRVLRLLVTFRREDDCHRWRSAFRLFAKGGMRWKEIFEFNFYCTWKSFLLKKYKRVLTTRRTSSLSSHLSLAVLLITTLPLPLFLQLSLNEALNEFTGLSSSSCIALIASTSAFKSSFSIL